MTRTLLALTALAITLPSGATSRGDEGVEDPSAAWRQYLLEDTTIEPDLRFPHANCFRVAAGVYGLPEPCCWPSHAAKATSTRQLARGPMPMA